MSPEFDFVIPLYRWRWNTQAVLEGITRHYQPRAIHIVTPAPEAKFLQAQSQDWQTVPCYVHAEETFFPNGLTKETICAELDLGQSLYTPGWFYQQLLKLGAAEGIEGLSEWYVVWDSDLLPVETWPLVQLRQPAAAHTFALLQHKQWGNAQIVDTWSRWIRSVLAVEPLSDSKGTFIPHHMWFRQAHLDSFKRQLNRYFSSDEHWLLLMMRSANQFGTFSEYWSYVSWVAAKAPEDLAFHPYATYGATTERFFDDGTGLFSVALRKYLQIAAESSDSSFSPAYAEVMAFIQAEYGSDRLPSSLSFESSPRHLKKNPETMHIEELNSRWNPRRVGAS
ncbi:MAG: hypothetical protein HC873_12450 [Leptolyngbyaceae cyanobacterium SL_1_1]|nr:hypothetical protein [Leptolyngbyaceae cyanobacterium RM2_2_21]NJN01293.1 hypothetical protein [Leptolyngbyaceae cyanobacterium RM1_1_2]NJO10329.1 hypothetical protein [Leptolyngbyaceae cyanobacterium SL_1_1]